MTIPIVSGPSDPATGATSPEQLPQVFAAAFNSGDPEAIERVYEPEGLLISPPGSPLRGEARRDANATLAGLGVPIEVTPRQVYLHGDLALLVVDWSLSGTARDGSRVDVHATATDVARRGPDGLWRYAIDNPFGTSR